MPRWISTFASTTAACLLASAATAQLDAVNLSGTWQITADANDPGDTELVPGQPNAVGDVWLPGAIQAQGYGETPRIDSPWVGDVREQEWAHPVYAPYREADNFKMPFWLHPDRVFVGPAIFTRSVSIPEAWRGQHVTLHLERAKWVTEASINGRPLGKRDSLSTPHEYDVGVIEPGTYKLELRIDNRMAYGVGPNAHSMTDHTQTNWNGVVGAIELQVEPLVSVEQVHVTPSARGKSAAVRVTVINRTDEPQSVELATVATNTHAASASTEATVTVPANSEQLVDMRLDLGDDAMMWSEFTPHAYTLTTTASSELGESEFETWFGLRDLGRENGRFTLNGTPIYLRGTLECAIFPKTGHPPTDVAEWTRIFNRMKEFGLNHMRYHSWCPPRAAFIAADRVGIYLQVEGPFWVNQGPQLGLGDPIDQYVYDETDRIIAEFGNHPSFLLMAYGNEPSGPGPSGQGENFLSAWLDKYKVSDPRRLFSSGSGWPIINDSQYHITYQPRIQRWGEGLNSTINSRPPTTRRDYTDFAGRFEAPIVAHEIGQWCVFPDFNEMGKYTGHLKPKNFEIFRDLLENNAMGHQSEDFLMASGRLQVLAYKEEVEAALRTRDFGGFQLLDIHDFPGQGTALVGVLDPFWDPKPYITAEEWRAFCGPVTPIARFDGRVFTTEDTFEADIEIAQFGPGNINDALVTWSIVHDDGTEIGSGSFTRMTLDVGKVVEVGTIRTPLSGATPGKATLTVSIDRHEAGNNWDIWIYDTAPVQPFPQDVHVTTTLDDEAGSVLGRGGKVLLLAPPRRVEGGVAFGFSPVFWNTAWTNNQPPHTLGIHVDPGHPLFADFTTGFHTDWQWWDLIGYRGAQAAAMVIDDLPSTIEPLVQPIDTWFRSRRLASVFEASVGGGKLMVSSMDITTDLDKRHAARQFRSSLIDYMSSPEYNPVVEVEAASIRDLFAPPSPIEMLGARVSDAAVHENAYGPRNAIDGDPNTFWHTRFSGGRVALPHNFTVELAKPQPIVGISYLPRQDNSNNAKIIEYEVHTSNDGTNWQRQAAGSFATDRNRQIVDFASPVQARFVRLVSLRSVGGAISSIAELDVVLE
ncbi:MAG: discoidin domain-containing protein [Planctomycetota bacterium]